MICQYAEDLCYRGFVTSSVALLAEYIIDPLIRPDLYFLNYTPLSTIPNGLAAGYAATALIIHQIAYAILDRFPAHLLPAAIRASLPRAFISLALSLTITPFMVPALFGISFTLPVSLGLSGVTVLAIATYKALEHFFNFSISLHGPRDILNRPPILNYIENLENRNHRNLDRLRDYLGYPRRFPGEDLPIPYQRSTRELAFVSIYTATMFIGGYLSGHWIAMPLANGIYFATTALIDSVSRVLFARLNLWNLNVTEFTSGTSLFYSYFVCSVLAQPFFPMPVVPATSILVIAVAKVAYEIFAPSLIERWIYTQPPLPAVQPVIPPLQLELLTA